MGSRARLSFPLPIFALALVLLSGSAAWAQAPAPPAPAPTPPPPPQAPPAQPAPPAQAAPPPEEDVLGEEPVAPSEGVPAEPPPPTAAEAAAAAPEVTAEVPVEVPAALPAAEPGPSDDIVVTGSRIKRSPELTSSVPVAVLDRKDLEKTGATNAADVVAQLTAAQGSGFQGGGNPGNRGGGAVGAVMVNLRGLGSGATLVLVNGRRLVPTGGGAGTETFSDIGVIPLAAIERIEVLKGGGSAIYGADAVAGVVNIITRTNFDGLRLEVDGQTTSRADQQDFTVSGAWGAHSDHGRVTVATSYLHRSPMLADTREFGRVANVDQAGFPGTFIAPGFDPSDPMRTRFPDPACNMVPGSEVRKSVINGMERSDETCVFNYAAYQSILSELERGNILANASYDITDHTSVFAEFLANRTRSSPSATPAYSVPPPLLVVPANHVDNIFGRQVSFLGRPFGKDFGARLNSVGDDTYRVVAGVKGDFAGVGKDSILETWEWELHASWATSRSNSVVQDTLRANLQSALNSCSDPSDLSKCYNPFYSSVDGTGTPNTQSVIDYVYSAAQTITDHSLQTYFGSLSGDLFGLPGGDVGFALGAELRYEWRMSQIDHDSNQQLFSFILGNPDGYGERNVYSGFLELRWPLIKGIELNTAARIEHYTDIESTTPSPFVGLTIDVGDLSGGKASAPPIIRFLQFTGQATWAFRAPSLFQAYPGFVVAPTALTVPPSPVPAYLPVLNYGNPDLEPETALILSAGINWKPFEELALRAEYWDYNYDGRIAVESSQQAIANDQYLMMMGMGGDPRVVRDPATGLVQRIEVTQRNIDGSVRTNGIDFGAMLTITGRTFGGGANDFGSFNAGVDGTLTLSYTYPAAQAARLTVPNTSPTMTLDPPHCDMKECEAVGSRNYATFAPPLPRWRFNFPVGWSMNGHMITLIGHYMTGIEDDNAVHADGTLGRLSPVFTLDAQYAYTIRDWIGKELSLRIGCYNVFDRLPDQTMDLNGFESMLYDPRGAMFYAKASATF
ncbi:MAG TPA: TonB-dependent receptor [Polyangiales bacterium]|nr:TonB-dependent receptor [Polyangiales bacterium]